MRALPSGLVTYARPDMAESTDGRQAALGGPPATDRPLRIVRRPGAVRDTTLPWLQAAGPAIWWQPR
jgi:hypothetical protein